MLSTQFLLGGARIEKAVSNLYERVLSDPLLLERIEEMHYNTTLPVVGRHIGSLNGGSEFLRILMKKSNLIYLYPSPFVDADSITGFVSLRYVPFEEPKKPVIKGGLFGYLRKHDITSIFSQGQRFINTVYNPVGHRMISGTPRRNKKLRQLMQQIGYEQITREEEIREYFADMGYLKKKQIRYENGEIFYENERGDEKILMQYKPKNDAVIIPSDKQVEMFRV